MLSAISHSGDTGPLGKMAKISERCTYNSTSIDNTVRMLMEILTEIEYSLDRTADTCFTSYHVQVHTGLVLDSKCPADSARGSLEE
jgi:hypothetical protein